VPHVRICAGGGPQGPSLPRLKICTLRLLALERSGVRLAVKDA